jgi:hypothetical protein
MATRWSAYEYQPSFVLGFHGCDKSTAEKILSGKEPHLLRSEKKYDWLGHGIYFWEGNPSRALAWAEHRKSEKKIRTPTVVGAIIDLRHCLDLFDQAGISQVQQAHTELALDFKKLNLPMPMNVGATPDKAGRVLDCVVLNALHKYRENLGEVAYDSVRAPFLEGKEIYTGAGFRSENHIQLCVRSTDCIKGYFRPLLSD